MSLAQSKNKRRLKKVKNLHVYYEKDNLCYLLKFLKQYLDIENSIFLICLKNYNQVIKQLFNGSADNRSNNFPLGIGKDQSVILPSAVDFGQQNTFVFPNTSGKIFLSIACTPIKYLYTNKPCQCRATDYWEEDILGD